MHNFIFAIALIFGASAAVSTGHYWREFTGNIPSDALKSGTDKNGKPVYVGQAFFKNVGLLPTTIRSDSESVTATAWGKDFTSSLNIKILCTATPDKFEWIPTSIEKMHLLTNCNLVTGGTETETVLYIGRVIHEREMQIGKIFPSFSKYNGLALPQNGKEANYKNFEILTYNCSKKTICDNMPDIFK